MSTSFPDVGFDATLEIADWDRNMRKYLSDLSSLEKAERKSAQSTENMTSTQQSSVTAMRNMVTSTKSVTASTQGMGRGVQGATGQITNMLQRLNIMPPQLQSVTQGLGGMQGGLGGIAGGMGTAAAAGGALVAAFIALGMHGSTMPGIIQAFDIATRSAGTLGNTLLNDLSAAARGTVSDIELMRLSNLALAGAEQEVAEALGQGGLAGLMEIARAQARATGQDVDFLFDSLVKGVKRGSKQLIDNTGLVINATDANAAYAESIGVSVDSLTDAQKQVALLNATLAAGQQSVDTYGQGPLQAGERLAQLQVVIKNVFDQISVAIQPMFNGLLSYWGLFLDAVIFPLKNILLPIFSELIKVIYGPAAAAFDALRSGASVLLPVWQSMQKWIMIVVGAIRYIGKGFNWLIQQIAKALGPVKDIVKKYLVEPFAKMIDPVEFAKRGGLIIGAFAEGLMWAANTFVLPAVKIIAQAVADFLMGFSPPKKGPLSKIDKGGSNVMQAWMSGFAGVSLDPVEKVAADVDAVLGDIGTLSHEQVQSRLLQLDAAVQPFIDSLKIAEAQTKSIIEPLEAAQDALQNKATRAVQQFMAGEISAEELRAIDTKQQALYERVEMYKDANTEQELQLSMVQAMQAEERALLNIQLSRTKAAEEETEEKEAAAKAAATATKTASTGGGAAAEETAGAAGGGGGFEDFGEGGIDSWLTGFDDSEIDELFSDVGTSFLDGLTATGADEQMATLTDNLTDIGDAMSDIGESEPFQGLVSSIDDIFGSGENSILTKMSTFKDGVVEILDLLFAPAVGLFNTIDLSAVRTAFTGVFGSGPTALTTTLSLFEGFVSGMFNAVTGTIAGYLRAVSEPLSDVYDFWEAVFGGEVGSIEALIGLWETTLSDLFGSEGSVWGIFDGMPSMLSKVFVAPFKVAINAMLSLIEQGLNFAINTINSWTDSAIIQWGIDAVNEAFDTNVSAGINEITIPRLRSGGMFSGGMARVHYGEMLVGAQGNTMVFPKRWVNAMDRLAMASQRYPMHSAGGQAPVYVQGGTSMNINQTFNGPTDSQSVQLAWRQMRAQGTV